jgi:hypothetical protein
VVNFRECLRCKRLLANTFDFRGQQMGIETGLPIRRRSLRIQFIVSRRGVPRFYGSATGNLRIALPSFNTFSDALVAGSTSTSLESAYPPHVGKGASLSRWNTHTNAAYSAP